ncbi:MAG: RNA polymerase sigma factor [Longimicrobiales bacterium]
MTEADLIRDARVGNPAAVRALYERHAPRVYAVVRRIAGDEHAAQDCAQEAWIRAIEALPSFRGDARFSTWLHRIAVNEALQHVRKDKRREKRREPMPRVIPVEPTPPDVLLEERLERALDQLPGGMRQVLTLHDVEGHTHREIGEMLGIAEGTSKSQLSKARAKMRDILRTLRASEQEGEMEACGT